MRKNVTKVVKIVGNWIAVCTLIAVYVYGFISCRDFIERHISPVDDTMYAIACASAVGIFCIAGIIDLAVKVLKFYLSVGRLPEDALDLVIFRTANKESLHLILAEKSYIKKYFLKKN